MSAVKCYYISTEVYFPLLFSPTAVPLLNWRILHMEPYHHDGTDIGLCELSCL
jgi:hypothetical protein